MTAMRYIAILPRHRFDADAHAHCRALLDRAAPLVDGTATFEVGSALIRVLGDPVVPLEADGLVLGHLYERAGMGAAHELPAAEIRLLLSQGPERLIERYWGGWVAFFAGPAKGLQVARAPFGELPCYRMETDAFQVIGSDVELIRGTGLYRPVVDWEQTRLQLALGEFARPRTCLEGLDELSGGRTVTLGDNDATETMVWSPWSFTTREMRIEDRNDATAQVRSAVHAAVTARASAFDRIVLKVSGGLDSSIIAAVLGDEGHGVDALNLVTASASGDERHHARRLCDWLSIPLHERMRDVAAVDVTRSHAAGLPRPCVRLFRQESERHADQLAAQTGASAIFSGGGGDNVFCSLASSAPLADRLLTSGPGRSAMRTATEISRIAPAPLGTVIADGMRRAWLGKPALRPYRDLSLFSPSAREALPDDKGHPWLDCPAGALPGSAGHVRLITLAQWHVENSDPRNRNARISPLMAQPIIEACLRVPSWLWLDGGRDRSIARRAFCDALPLDTVTRRSKGTPSSFSAQILEDNRTLVRRLIADGRLTAHDLIDRDATLAILDDPRPVRGEHLARLLQFVDCETWAASWDGAGS